MNEKIAWVTDSTTFLDEELKGNPDVYVIPMMVFVEGKEYLDGVDIHPKDLFALMDEKKAVPKTSQPSVGTFYELYKKLEDSYDRIYSFHVSSFLSGTVSSSQQAAQMVNIPVHTVDSLILSYPTSFLMKKAMKWLSEGVSNDETLTRIDELKQKNETYVLIGDLVQLHRSGRMNGVQYFLGSMLNVKPIISIEDGKLSSKEKVRSEKQAQKKIFSYLQRAVDEGIVKECFILYGNDESQTIEWYEELTSLYPNIQFYKCALGTAIGVHAGGNTLGISWYNE
ncbi:DegV family protein [Peribacillus alkalitolerans]|uniref:DegV family protein n=1 Tax=Peribacillus alkalitolerans TaxID=1550385 RepID=UPI0013D0957D|nr:DegV family protein [Peribacillus alkalitolerans]